MQKYVQKLILVAYTSLGIGSLFLGKFGFFAFISTYSKEI